MRLFPEYADRIVHRAVTHQNNLVSCPMSRKINVGGYICNRCNQCKLGHVKERKESRGGQKERERELADHSSQPLHPLHRLLQPVKPCPLLNIPPLQHRNPLLQPCACFPLLRYHFIRLAEQLCR